jgi:DNA (cytosine-5)-methyltransferase 1
MKKATKPVRAFVDLFAGCGGLSLGLERAGFCPVFVNELNENARRSYIKNRIVDYPHLDNAQCADISELLEADKIAELKVYLKSKHRIDVEAGQLALVVGGPPCQGFSGIGHRRSYAVERQLLPSNHLYKSMAKIIEALQPKVFLFENVRGLKSARWSSDGEKGEIWIDVCNTFKAIKGYTISHAVVHAKDYGVPQNRPRVLIVGVRDNVDIGRWKRSRNTIADGFLPGGQKNSAPHLIDVLGDLIDTEYENGGQTTAYPRAAHGDVQKYYRKIRHGKRSVGKGSPLTEQEYSKHSPQVIKKFQHMLAKGVVHEDHRTKKFAQRVLPKKWDPEKGPCITATSLPDDYVHFELPRTLTVREWARLQGFPDWYEFVGSRTTGGLRRAGNPRAGCFDRDLPKYTQIGNAVPVKLAEAIGRHFRKVTG